MEDKEKAKDVQWPKKLNFNLPLLSTKRHCCQTLEEESWYGKPLQVPSDNDERIPFSWEQAPGKPKHVDKMDDEVQQVVETPRPRPPPCRWQQHMENVVKGEEERQVPKQEYDDEEIIVFSNDEDYAILDQTISCCDKYDNQGDNFTDAMEDVFSLSEAIDILERTRKADDDGGGGDDDEKVAVNCNELRNRVLECRGITSPSFIINRFLPDANAIAAASSSALNHPPTDNNNNNNNNNKQQRGMIISNTPTSCCRSSKSKVCDIRAISRSHESPKGCGMENLLPWRMKHKLCGIKSPVIITQQHQQQRSSSAPNKY